MLHSTDSKSRRRIPRFRTHPDSSSRGRGSRPGAKFAAPQRVWLRSADCSPDPKAERAMKIRAFTTTVRRLVLVAALVGIAGRAEAASIPVAESYTLYTSLSPCLCVPGWLTLPEYTLELALRITPSSGTYRFFTVWSEPFYV